MRYDLGSLDVLNGTNVESEPVSNARRPAVSLQIGELAEVVLLRSMLHEVRGVSPMRGVLQLVFNLANLQRWYS